MTRLRASISVIFALAFASWCAAAPPSASAASTAKCGQAWTIVKSPNRGTGANVLYKVSATSSADVWAVGYSRTATGTRTLAEHFDGASWSIVPTPSKGSSFFFGLSALTPTDAWAVGGETSGSGQRKNLVEHWDGSTWTIVASPTTKATNSNLNGVVALAANNAYAVGYNGQAVLLHWDGVQWSKLNAPRPAMSTFSALNAVSADPQNDVWLFGDFQAGAAESPMIARSTGGGFGLMANPALGGSYGILGASAPLSSTDVWTVGQFGPTSGPGQTLAEHWNGSAWSVATTPNPGAGDDEFAAVAAVGTNDVWATGYTKTDGSTWRTLIEQWNGSLWNVVSSPSPGGANDVLWGATTSGTTGWAVGSTTPTFGAPTQTLIERACGI
jgi:hypothetical protein